MDDGPSAVILFVRTAASDARLRTLVVNPFPGATVISAVILFVRRPASNSRSRTLAVNLVSGGTVLTPVSIWCRSKPSGVEWAGTVDGFNGFCSGTLME